MGDEKCNILSGRSKKKRPLGRPRHKWQNNIRKDFRKIVWEGVDWMHLV
jgi:hypothetical protein